MLVERELTLTLVGVVDEDDVHVGARVQLISAQLPDAEHDDGRWRAIAAQRSPKALGDAAFGLAERRVEGRRCEITELAGSDLDAGAAQPHGQ